MPTLKIGYSLTGPAPIGNTVEITYSACTSIARLELTDAQTYPIDLAMMPDAGLRGLLVVIDAVDADNNPVTDPVTVRWTSNGATKNEKLTPGGFVALGQPTAEDGITALSIVSTASCVVAVYAIG